MIVTFNVPQRGPGLPLSIPFRRNTVIGCSIIPAGDEPPEDVQFEVVNYSPNNGIASIVNEFPPDQIGMVLLYGDVQTLPGHSGHLRLRATLNGQVVGETEAFSVCAHPCAIQNGPDYVPHVNKEGSTVRAGMFIQVAVLSDSWQANDLDQVTDQEILSAPYGHSPSLQGQPAGPPQVAAPEPAFKAKIDRHRDPIGELIVIADQKTRGAPASWSVNQHDEFTCTRCGMSEPGSVPNSGYRVTRTIYTVTPGRLRFRVRKEPFAHTVAEMEVAAGPSGPFEVTLDIEDSTPAANEEHAVWGVLGGIG